MQLSFLCSCVLAFTSLCLVAALAAAGTSPSIFTIEATTASGSATWSFVPSAPLGEDFTWDLPGSVELRGPDNTIYGTLQSASVTVIADPVVNLDFFVEAAPELDTEFKITSPLLSFATIVPAVGRAQASITAIDLNDNGVTLTGENSINTAYRAAYNGFVFSGGTTFAGLISGVTAGSGSSDTVSEAFLPGFVFSPIGHPVSDISTQFHFVLSAADTATGTSTFEVTIPEPASLLLLIPLAAGLCLRRRTRSGRFRNQTRQLAACK
jgi:hypothetical protein